MQTQAVQQLGFIGWHQFRQARHVHRFGVRVSLSQAGHGLQHRHALQDHGHVFQGGGSAQAIQTQGLRGVDDRFAVALGQSLDQTKHMRAIGAAQHLAHRGFLQLATAKGNGLVGQAERIAHGAACGAGQQAQGLGLEGNVLLAQHMAQMLEHGFGGHGPQVELQAARQHGDRHFLWVGGGEHKFQIFGWLFERFQHRVERGVGEHVHLVNHEDLEAALHRLVNRLLEQALYLVHTTVGSGIELGVVDESTCINVATGLAHTARIGSDATQTIHTLAVERLGQHARHRGFAHTTGAGEQVGMVEALRGQRVGQRLHHVLLPHHLREGFGTVFTGEHKVGHKREILKRAQLAPLKERMCRYNRA